MFPQLSQAFLENLHPHQSAQDWASATVVTEISDAISIRIQPFDIG